MDSWTSNRLYATAAPVHAVAELVLADYGVSPGDGFQAEPYDSGAFGTGAQP